MGRSVSYPTNAEVTFTTIDIDEGDYFDFDEYIDSLQQTASSVWPSMIKCDKWLDREDHAIMENGHAYFGVSEYCGVVAMWLVAKEGILAHAWVSNAKQRLQKQFGTMAMMGRMSNGEAVFRGVGA